MKKTILIFATLLSLFACKNERKTETDSVNQELLKAVTTDIEKKAETTIIPQTKATFSDEKIELSGKITELENSAYINLKASDKKGDITYEVILDFEGKITLGKHPSTENFAYGITDAVHKFKLPQGGIVPTSYKQKSGEFEITKVENNQVDGKFSVEVYDMNKPKIVKTITGTFEKLPIKKVGEN
jgi:hypothetical protein